MQLSGAALLGYAGSPGFNQLVADRFPWICALLLHLMFWLLVVDQIAGTERPPPPDVPIEVDLYIQPLKRPAPEATFPSRESPMPDELPAPHPGQQGGATHNDRIAEPTESAALQTEPKDERTWHTATRLLGSNVLSDPRSRQAVEELGNLTDVDRIEQLCALEAMEQVRNSEPGFTPTRVVPYALESTSRNGNELYAPAAALRSEYVWYEIAYRCRLDATGSVSGFEYALGDRIDRALWDELGLAPVY